MQITSARRLGIAGNNFQIERVVDFSELSAHFVGEVEPGAIRNVPCSISPSAVEAIGVQSGVSIRVTLGSSEFTVDGHNSYVFEKDCGVPVPFTEPLKEIIIENLGLKTAKVRLCVASQSAPDELVSDDNPETDEIPENPDLPDTTES